MSETPALNQNETPMADGGVYCTREDMKYYPLYLMMKGEELGIKGDGTIELNGQKTTDAQAVFDYLVMFAKECSKE